MTITGQQMGPNTGVLFRDEVKQAALLASPDIKAGLSSHQR